MRRRSASPPPRLSLAALLVHPAAACLHAVSALGRPADVVKLGLWCAVMTPMRFAEGFLQQAVLRLFPTSTEYWQLPGDHLTDQAHERSWSL